MPAATTLDAFQQAVEAFAFDDLSLDVEQDAAIAARESITATGLLVLDEVHGVRENASIIRWVMTRFGLGGLALEWPSDLATVVHQFVASGVLADHPFLWMADGRITAGHFALFRNRASDSPISLTLFDGVMQPDSSWSDRDKAMADRVLSALPAPGGTLVVAGNAHTSLTETRQGTPMAARLAAERAGLRVVTIDYASGTFFNFGERRFQHRRNRDEAARLYLDDEGELVLRLPRTEAAIVPAMQ